MRKRPARRPEAPVPCIPVAWGELIDKITILEIKSARLKDAAALANVRAELAALRRAAKAAGRGAKLATLRRKLKKANETLWRIEDDIRACEAKRAFGPKFIALARSVYRTNDERAKLKRAISLLMRSSLIEEKQYARTKGRTP